MKTQDWLSQSTFEWTQPGTSGEGYVLMAAGETSGRLWFEGWSHKSATGETPFGRWQLRREGFWRPRYVVIQEDTGAEVAVYSPGWSTSEGTLQTGGGRRFHWGVRRFWGGEHTLVDESGRTVLSVTAGLGNFRWPDIFKQQGTVRREDGVLDGETLSILLLFAWWMMLVLAEEAASAAVVVMG
jgi:hypothetical protein